MNDALARWNIQVRNVNENKWWIGSEATYDRLPVVVWTPQLGDRRDAVAERIQVIKAANLGDDVRIAYDQASDRAVIRLPRYIARQLPKILANP